MITDFAITPTNGGFFKAGDELSFSATVEAGTRLSWNVLLLHNDHTHPMITNLEVRVAHSVAACLTQQARASPALQASSGTFDVEIEQDHPWEEETGIR